MSYQVIIFPIHSVVCNFVTSLSFLRYRGKNPIHGKHSKTTQNFKIISSYIGKNEAWGTVIRLEVQVIRPRFANVQDLGMFISLLWASVISIVLSCSKIIWSFALRNEFLTYPVLELHSFIDKDSPTEFAQRECIRILKEKRSLGLHKEMKLVIRASFA